MLPTLGYGTGIPARSRDWRISVLVPLTFLWLVSYFIETGFGAGVNMIPKDPKCELVSNRFSTTGSFFLLWIGVYVCLVYSITVNNGFANNNGSDQFLSIMFLPVWVILAALNAIIPGPRRVSWLAHLMNVNPRTARETTIMDMIASSIGFFLFLFTAVFHVRNTESDISIQKDNYQTCLTMSTDEDQKVLESVMKLWTFKEFFAKQYLLMVICTILFFFICLLHTIVRYKNQHANRDLRLVVRN